MSEELSSEDVKPDLSSKGIWQPLPQESPGSYTAFTTYLELGPDSTLEDVAEKTGRSLHAIRHLSARHHWMERAAAYRQHFSNTTLAAAQRERAKQAELSQMRDHIFRQQLWEASQSLLMACRKSLNKLLDDPKGKVAAYELASLYNLGLKLGCRANEPTNFTSEGPAPPPPRHPRSRRKSRWREPEHGGTDGVGQNFRPSHPSPPASPPHSPAGGH